MSEARVRAALQEVESLREFITQKSKDKDTINKVISNFQTSIVNKFKTLTDEFSKEIVHLDKKINGINQTMTNNIS